MRKILKLALLAVTVGVLGLVAPLAPASAAYEGGNVTGVVVLGSPYSNMTYNVAFATNASNQVRPVTVTWGCSGNCPLVNIGLWVHQTQGTVVVNDYLAITGSALGGTYNFSSTIFPFEDAVKVPVLEISAGSGNSVVLPPTTDYAAGYTPEQTYSITGISPLQVSVRWTVTDFPNGPRLTANQLTINCTGFRCLGVTVVSVLSGSQVGTPSTTQSVSCNSGYPKVCTLAGGLTHAALSPTLKVSLTGVLPYNTTVQHTFVPNAA